MRRVESSVAPMRQLEPRSLPSGAAFSRELSLARKEIERTVKHGFERNATHGAFSSAQHQVAMPDRSAHRPATAAGIGGADAGAREAFLRDIGPWSERAAASLGISPHLIAAHAALESGWGQRAIPGHDEPSRNLFGIKATRWPGNKVRARTTEVIDGKTVATTEDFRAYGSYAEAFDDYSHLLGAAGRYGDMAGVGSDVHAFARALKRGGYATDPHYEEKLIRTSRTVLDVMRTAKR